MADKKEISAVFDKEQNIKKWINRFKQMEAQTIYKIKDPVIKTYLDAIENTIKNTPSTSGETRAGWGKPLEVEGRSLAAVISPEAGIFSKKDTDPTQAALDRGMKNSIYRKEIDGESINLETINSTPGAIATEYGDSRTPPTAAVRQAAMTLAEDAKEAIRITVKEVSK